MEPAGCHGFFCKIRPPCPPILGEEFVAGVFVVNRRVFPEIEIGATSLSIKTPNDSLLPQNWGTGGPLLPLLRRQTSGDRERYGGDGGDRADGVERVPGGFKFHTLCG
ncbi:MAG: hypothetical protein JWQ02_2725, partial [Capsulimonas sp.]|nr:hypothetical protein [Capsulimonas sp.]